MATTSDRATAAHAMFKSSITSYYITRYSDDLPQKWQGFTHHSSSALLPLLARVQQTMSAFWSNFRRIIAWWRWEDWWVFSWRGTGRKGGVGWTAEWICVTCSPTFPYLVLYNVCTCSLYSVYVCITGLYDELHARVAHTWIQRLLLYQAAFRHWLYWSWHQTDPLWCIACTCACTEIMQSVIRVTTQRTCSCRRVHTDAHTHTRVGTYAHMRVRAHTHMWAHTVRIHTLTRRNECKVMTQLWLGPTFVRLIS